MKKGFTIIEVLIVIGIIAILTVIIFPSINNIRKKNRDTERVGDISAIQLGLALYKNKNNVYPANLDTLLPDKYVTLDSITPPDSSDSYHYVPLARNPSTKCTYYHLGTLLELSSGQIDTVDNFSSVGLNSSTPGDYKYCGNDEEGIDGNNVTNPLMYDVRP